MQQSMRKEKLRKVVCFIKSFNMIINHFFCFASSFTAQIFAFLYQNDARNFKRQSREQQIARNGKLQCLFQ